MLCVVCCVLCVVCCVLCECYLLYLLCPVYVLGKGGLHYVLTFFVSTCSHFVSTCSHIVSTCSHIVSTCSHIVSTCSQINVSKCEPENYTLNFLQLYGLKNVHTHLNLREPARHLNRAKGFLPRRKLSLRLCICTHVLI